MITSVRVGAPKHCLNASGTVLNISKLKKYPQPNRNRTESFKSILRYSITLHIVWSLLRRRGRVHVNIALADEFKLSETYLVSSQTINWKLPISCKNRSGKYGFQPLFIFFRLVGKTQSCLLNDFDNKNSL